VSDELPDRLRASAEEYEPDRDRMWSRVSEGMREPRGARAEPARTGWRIPHLALATGATVVLIGAVVLFGQSLGLGPVVGPTPEPPAGGRVTATAEASDPATTDGAETTTGEGPESTGEGETTTEETTADDEPGGGAVDWLQADGSFDEAGNDYWSQANLVVRNEETLTELTVELRFAIGGDLEPTGSWSTDNSRFADAQVTEEDGFLVFRWSLREGAVLPAGEYTLASQFNHQSGPRGADEDTYAFEAVTESGEDGRAEGGFA
jgi:hypothetical protein